MLQMRKLRCREVAPLVSDRTRIQLMLPKTFYTRNSMQCYQPTIQQTAVEH